MQRAGKDGKRSSRSFMYAKTSCPFSLADWIRLMTAAARCPARRLPANSQLFRPMAIGRMRFSTQLLCVPCEGTVETSVQIRPGQLSLRPEAQGAVQEVTNGLKHFLKRPRRRSAGSAGRNANEH